MSTPSPTLAERAQKLLQFGINMGYEAVAMTSGHYWFELTIGDWREYDTIAFLQNDSSLALEIIEEALRGGHFDKYERWATSDFIPKTPEESEALVARIKQIWQPDGNDVDVSEFPEKGRAHFDFHCRFQIQENDVRLYLSQTSYIHFHQGREDGNPKLLCHIEANGEVKLMRRDIYRNSPNPEDRKRYEQDQAFADEWEETFRRSLWLMGIPIECTQHEKLEWKLWQGKALKVLWERIWQPEKVNVWAQAGEDHEFYFDASLKDGLHVVVSVVNGATYCTLCNDSLAHSLSINEEQQIIQPPLSYGFKGFVRTEHWEQFAESITRFGVEQKEFATKWLPLFRRNAWLSGCLIEHNQHEELEWGLWLNEQPQS